MGAITTAVGTALTFGIASGSTASAIGTLAIGGGLLYGANKLMSGLSGPDLPQQQQAPGFDADAERRKADVKAEEDERRRRVGAAKNKGVLSDPNDEAKLGTTGLLGAY